MDLFLYPPTYVITLKRNPERTSHMTKELKRMDYRNSRFIEGVDGSGIPTELVARISQSVGYNLLPNELGCSMAHIKAWNQAMLEWNEMQVCAIFFENDIDLTANCKDLWVTYLRELPNLNTTWDILYLAYGDYSKKGSVGFSKHLNKPNAPMGAYAYALSRSGLLKLIRKAKDMYGSGFHGEVDGTMCRMCQLGELSAYSCNPFAATHGWKYKSSILEKNGGGPRGGAELGLFGRLKKNGGWLVILFILLLFGVFAIHYFYSNPL